MKPALFIVGQRSGYVRRYTTSDTMLKSALNPAWYRLSSRSRLAHDELERYAGRLLTAGRIPMARLYKTADWKRIALTTPATVAELVAAGWAEWDSDDLQLLHTDLAGEKRYRAQAEHRSEKGILRWERERTQIKNQLKSIRSDDENVRKSIQLGEKTPCQMADLRHNGDAPSASASASASDLVLRERSLRSPPPPQGGKRPGGGGGGGGSKPGVGQTDGSESFETWWALWDKPEGKASALAEWNALAMLPAGVNACMEFTRRELGNARNTRDGGRFKTRGDKFLLERWKPKLSEFRKKAARKNGYGGPETAEAILSSYLGGEA